MKNLKKYLPKLLIFLSFISVFALGGCKENIKELERQILESDPSFQEELAKKKNLQEELNSSRAGYVKESRAIDAKVIALKERKKIVRKEYENAIEDIKRQLQPDQRKLKQEIFTLKGQLKVKKVMLRDIERDIKDVSGLVEKQETLALSSEELQSWNDRLETLIEARGETLQEIEKIRKEIEITKLKLKVLVLK